MGDLLDPPRRQRQDSFDTGLEARVATKRGESAEPEPEEGEQGEIDPWAELGSPKMTYSRLHGGEAGNHAEHSTVAASPDGLEYSWNKAFREQHRIGERRRSVDEPVPRDSGVKGAKARQLRVKNLALTERLS